MKKFRIRYFTARKVVFLALVASLVMLFAYMYIPNRAVQKFLLVTASFVFFGSFVFMTVYFRCPHCGCPFMRKALMITACPACGHKLDDFYLGDKVASDEEVYYYQALGLELEEPVEDEDEYYEEDFEEYADEEYTEELPEEE